MGWKDKPFWIKVVLIITVVIILTLLILSVAVTFLLKSMSSSFKNKISPEMSGVLYEKNTNQPIQDISICWKRMHEDGFIAKVVDTDCTKTGADGTFLIPSVTGSGGATSITIYANYKSRMEMVDDFPSEYREEIEEGRMELHLRFFDIENENYDSSEKHLVSSEYNEFSDTHFEDSVVLNIEKVS